MHINIRRIYDPLYGPMELTDEEYSLLLSPEIQRLRYVRMCNINSLLVTGASEISRFEHIFGVLRLTKEWLKSKGRNLSDEAQRDICASAILHDVQTGPFGHSLQYVFEDSDDTDFIHDDIAHGGDNKFYQMTDANASFMGRPFSNKNILGPTRWEKVASLIKGEGELGPLINGTIDLDNIDNVVRLAYHVGVASPEDAKLALEIAKDINVGINGLEVSESSISHLVRWQSIRHKLYNLLLLDWAEFSAKAMLTKAMNIAVKEKLLGADSWLKTDLEFYTYLENESKGEHQAIGELVKRIKIGDLYSPLSLLSSTSIDKYNNITNIDNKNELEKSLSIELFPIIGRKLEILIHPILDYKKTDRAVTAFIRERNESIIIGKDSKVILLGVFTPSNTASTEKRRQISIIIEDFFKKLGFDEIQELQDPMMEKGNKQLELL